MRLNKKLVIGLSFGCFTLAVMAHPVGNWYCDPTQAGVTIAPGGMGTFAQLQPIPGSSYSEAIFFIPITKNCIQSNVCELTVSIANVPLTSAFLAANNNATTTAYGLNVINLPTTIYAFTDPSQINPGQCIIVSVNGQQYQHDVVTLTPSILVNTGESQSQIGGNWGL